MSWVAQPSFDKQYVRDWLRSSEAGWDGWITPHLPEEVVEATRARYVEAYERRPTYEVPKLCISGQK